jgi:tetratricopeptide (TPR) repeat protein
MAVLAASSTPVWSDDALPPAARVPLAELLQQTSSGETAGPALEDQPAVWTHYETALELVADREYDLAVGELDAALKLAQGDRFRLLHLLAQARYGQGRKGEALALAQLAAQENPHDIDTQYLIGRWYRDLERCDSAIVHFAEAARQASCEPENAHSSAAWYELGTCLEAAGRVRGAVEAYTAFDQAVWVEYPAHREAPLLQGVMRRFPQGLLPRRLELLKQLGDLAARVDAAREALTRAPANPYLQRLYVRALLDADRADDALVYCRQQLEGALATETSGEADAAADEAENERLALLPLAIDAAARADRLTHWVDQVRGNVAASDGSVRLAGRLARHLEQRGYHDQAATLWEALAQAAPLNGAYQWAWAGAVERGGRRAQALTILAEYLRRAEDRAELPPARLRYWLDGVAVTPAMLDDVAARKAGKELDFAEAITLGMVATAGQRDALAGELFVLASAQRQDLAVPLVAAGRAALARFDWKTARAQAQAALERVPDMAAAQLVLAESYSGQDRYDEAEAAYKAAVAGAPEDPAVLLALGRHYKSVENLLAAQRYLHQAWVVDRSNADAVEELVGAYLAAQKVAIARDCVQEAEGYDLPADALRRMRTELRFAQDPYGPAHLAQLQEQFAAYPQDVKTGLKLAAGLYLAGRVNQAQEALDQVQTIEPDNERGLYVQARVHLRRLRFDEALVIMRELTRRYPNRLNALDLLGTAYLSDFQVDEARQVMKRILALGVPDEQRRQYRLDLVDAYTIFGEYDEPLKMVRQWRAEDPNDQAWPWAERQILMRMDRADEALEQVRGEIRPLLRELRNVFDDLSTLSPRAQIEPGDEQVRLRLQALAARQQAIAEGLLRLQSEFVQLAGQADRPEEAERAVRRWMVDLPDQRVYQEWLVEALLDQDKGSEALEVISQYRPEDAAGVLRVYVWEARARTRVESVDAGLALLDERLAEQFVIDDPLSTERLKRQKILLLFEAEAYERALGLVEEWLEASPPGTNQYADLLNLKLLILQAAQREAEQIEVAQQLLELRPDSPGLNNDLGYTWADRGEQLEDAERMIRVALASEPLNAAYLDSLGWVHYKQGRFEEARKQLLRATRLRLGQDAVVFDHLGDTEYRLGHKDAAGAAWKQASAQLEEKPVDERTTNDAALLAALRAKLNALEKGASVSTARVATD